MENKSFLFLILGFTGLSSVFGVGDSFGTRSYAGAFGSQDAIEEHDLLQAIRVPFDDPRTQYFEAGLDGFPAYGLREGADIKSHYRLFLPDRLYRDFALLATLKPDGRRETSYLFAVVNPIDTIVQFGLRISPSTRRDHHVISLLYTDVGSQLVTQDLVSFEVPLLTRKWNRFALKVVGDNVTLFLNCKEHSSQMAFRNPKELSFDSASTLYIGQAGPILKGNFQGAIQELKLYGMPGVAEVQCDDSLSSFGSSEGSGDFGADLGDFYDYPSYDEDYSETDNDETGSGDNIPPPPPRPPPTPDGSHDLFNLSGILGSGSEGSQNEPFDTGGTCSCNHTEILLKLPETLRGLPGPIGLQGEVGPAGPVGPLGPRGDKGDIGVFGPEGIQGKKGEPGLIGPQGLPGPPGPAGQTGTPSFLGMDDMGPSMVSRSIMGPKGDTGDSGPSGSKGERGYMGEKGERGLAGPSGDRGLPGPPGFDGFPGKEGGKGEKGERGSPGLVTTAELGGILNSVDTIKGDVGPSGPQGDRGLPGLPGEKGEIGPAGPPGSAALDFDGNLQMLRGPPGEPGKRGKRGRAGPPGPRGLGGEIGIPGWPGRPGPPGLAIQGPKGEKGEPAVLPPDFFKYEVSGIAGKPGPQGPPGLSIVGEKGDIGPMGPPGPSGDSSRSGSESSKVVPGAVVVLTRESMLKMSELSPVGTITFVKDEESLFVRVSEGWKPLLMGELIRAEPVMGNVDLTTEPPVIRPPFEVSSLINRIEGPSLRIAALNDPWSGDMHGVRGADYACYRQARNANLQGTFRAFLSSWVQNLDSIVKFSDRNLPVVNTKGDLLFNSWAELFQHGSKFQTRPPKLYSFGGKNVLQDFHWPQKIVWHGADPAGVRARQSYCEAWHSDAVSSVGLASDLLKNQLLGQEQVGCNNKLIVLCIEIASQHNYRRKRDVNENKDLTFDQYTHFLDHLDQQENHNPAL